MANDLDPHEFKFGTTPLPLWGHIGNPLKSRNGKNGFDFIRSNPGIVSAKRLPASMVLQCLDKRGV